MNQRMNKKEIKKMINMNQIMIMKKKKTKKKEKKR